MRHTPANFPAFPTADNAVKGMTMLEYLAAQAMAALIARSDHGPAANVASMAGRIAAAAFDIAEAMIAEAERRMQ